MYMFFFLVKYINVEITIYIQNVVVTEDTSRILLLFWLAGHEDKK